LRFKGSKEKYSSLYYIGALVQNKNIDKTIINFVVDTGSTLTILSVRDAIKLKLLSIKEETSFGLINNHNLDIEKTHTSIGSMDLLKLEDVILTFYFDSRCCFAEYFEAIYVAKPMIENEDEYRLVMEIPSVLGIDVLKNYKIEFSNDTVLLER
jgi:predicted aspartyl protease